MHWQRSNHAAHLKVEQGNHLRIKVIKDDLKRRHKNSSEEPEKWEEDFQNGDTISRRQKKESHYVMAYKYQSPQQQCSQIYG